ncbi:MAG TPA: ABC transporter permease [Parachlamydiaceae bacterium]|nr:ABC transporter permease [Parachlamydiaceae bacterium]
MFNYLIRRLILLPITLFFIILVNFVIINLAPGDPSALTEVSQDGAGRKEDKGNSFSSDDRYLQFREHYGLTLPILFNNWPNISSEKVKKDLSELVSHKKDFSEQEMSFKEYDALRILFGDQSRFIMKDLLSVIEDPKENRQVRTTASRFFARGGSRPAYLGGGLSDQKKAYNRKINEDHEFLSQLIFLPSDSEEKIEEKAALLKKWYQDNKAFYHFEPDFKEKIALFFFETRFFKYMNRVLTLDFGTLRNDPNKSVITEVTKRLKYSLTLSVLPMLLTFFLCQVFGSIMAFAQNRIPDYVLNIIFLVLFAIPVFVAAPFLIEKVAINGYFPFTNTPIPYSGFTSEDAIYNSQTSWGRLLDTGAHIFLPIVAIMYGSLAAQSRLSRTAVLEVMRQDYIRTAWAKGASPLDVLARHIGKNASITIVTSLAASFGLILGGSLIVETLFEINGFGKFFYDAILNRDYNVIMFSAIMGSLLSLLGLLAADIAYTLLDPRLTLD